MKADVHPQGWEIQINIAVICQRGSSQLVATVTTEKCLLCHRLTALGTEAGSGGMRWLRHRRCGRLRRKTLDSGSQLLVNIVNHLLVFSPIDHLCGHAALGMNVDLGGRIAQRRQCDGDLLAPGAKSDTMVKAVLHAIGRGVLGLKLQMKLIREFLAADGVLQLPHPDIHFICLLIVCCHGYASLCV